MSANPSSWSVSYVEYVAFEDEAHERHEFFDGEIVAMAGASPRHNILVERVHVALLSTGCQLLGSSQRLAVATRDRGWVGYYPDLSVVCDDLRTQEHDSHAIVNPKFLVEVTSKSTEKRDRGIKLDDYRAIASLEGYLIVSHTRLELEYWFRSPGELWQRTIVTEGGSLEALAISVDDIYRALPPEVGS
jgi:Uma2 family endonuclease